MITKFAWLPVIARDIWLKHKYMVWLCEYAVYVHRDGSKSNNYLTKDSKIRIKLN